MKPKYNSKQEIIDALGTGEISRRTVSNTGQYYRKRMDTVRMKMFQEALSDTRPLSNPWRINKPTGKVLPFLHKKYLPTQYDEVEALYKDIMCCNSYNSVMNVLAEWAILDNADQATYKYIYTILYDLHQKTLFVEKMIAKDCECGDFVGHKD